MGLCLLLQLICVSVDAQPGNCQLICNDTIQISLGTSCLSEVLGDDILEGNLDPDCLGPFQVNIFDPQGNVLPTSPFLDDTYEGQYLNAEFIDLASNNLCEFVILVEDFLIPQLDCHNLNLDCGTAPRPIVPVIVPAPIVVNALGACASITIPATMTGALVDVNVSFEVAHNNVSELSASLLSPAGTSVDLFNNSGNLSTCTGANLSLTFDDEARSTYLDFENNCFPDPAISGQFQPLAPLAAFQGESSIGNWSFTLCNTSTVNTAMASNISLSLNANAVTIPFPLPNTATVSQTSAQLGTTSFTIEDFDNCTDAILSYSDNFVDQLCTDSLAQILYRTWIIEDAYGNTDSCTDTISFLRLPAGSIDFPQNYDDTAQPSLACEDKMTDPGNSIIPNVGWNALPNGHPSPFNEYYPAPNEDIVKWFGTGVPVAQGCESLNYAYTDIRVDVCPAGASAACFKVLRSWTIWETCSGQNYDVMQTIKVADTAAPQLGGLADVTISTPSTACVGEWYATVPTLTDNCNPEANLSYTLTSSAGTVSYVAGLDRYYIANLPLGIHTVSYTANDCCGNAATTTINLTVEDQVPPTATCVSFVTSSLSINGIVKVLPVSFDDGSTDNCGLVYYKVIRMEDLLGTEDGSNSNQSSTTCDGENGDDNTNRFGNQIYFDDFVTFCCEDRSTNNHMVVLRTFDVDPGAGPINPIRMRQGGDLDGHFNDCMSEVQIEDKLGPMISCPADVTLLCTDNWKDLNLTGEATAYDNCELDTVTYNDVINLDPCRVGTVARIWTAIDHSGRSVSCVQTITMIDNEPAVVTFPQATVFVECGEEFDLDITGRPQVSDNCRLLGINKNDQLHFFADSCLRKIVRVWTVMDLCSDSMWSDVQVIKIEDTTPPEVEEVPDITVDCDNIPPPANPMITDSCDPTLDVEFTEETSPGPCLQESTITRTWTVSDNCENSTVVTQIITVVDNVDPVFADVPADVNLECDAAVPTAAPNATDNCDPMVDIIYEETTTPGTCSANFTLERKWTATDDCGNSSVAIQLVTFEDTIIPVFTFVPADTLLECDEVVPNTDPLAIDNCDTSVLIVLVEQITPGACTANQSILRTWTATDDCGNSTTSSQTLTIVDSTPPALSSLPADTLLACDAALPDDEPIAMDNCDANPTRTFSELRTDGNCGDNFTLTRTWTYVDECGNDSSYSQILTLVDTVAPIFLNVPVDVTLECDGTPVDLAPDAVDNCDTTVMVTFMEDDMQGCIGNTTITRTWMATDRCGNSSTITQQITFMDSTPPVLSGVPADATVECDAVPGAATVTAMDACDPMVQVVAGEMRVDGPCLDSYTLTRTWSATDDCGNMIDTMQVLTVVDTTAPTFDTNPQDVTLSCTDDTDPSAGGLLSPPTASDNCDLQVAVTFADVTMPGGCTDESGITRTWTATDNCGNISTRVQVISILDEEAPVLVGVPDDVTVLCDDIPGVSGGVSATDNCDTLVTIVFEEETTAVICTDAYTLLRRWIATDNCGNELIDTQLVVVIDTIPPEIVGIPLDTIVQCNEVPEPPVIGVDITGSDNCDNTVQITFVQDTTDRICEDEFTLVRRWIATDNCGNIAVDSQRLMLIDTVPPSLFNIPADLTVTCDRLVDTTTNMVVSATDNCDQNVDVEYTERPDGQCPNTFIIIRQWTATDNCGNVNTKRQIVNVLDTVPPLLICPSDITIDIRASQNPSIFSPKCDTLLELIATATDNCADTVFISNDSPFANDTTGIATGSYPIGVHVVNFTAQDRCGNFSMCSTTITVIDNARPTLLCSDFEIILDETDSIAVLTTDDFVTLLVDCSIDTIFFEEPFLTDTLVLDCAFFINNPLFDVKITAMDTSGNSTSCTLEDMTISLPASNPLLCGTPPPFSYITGHVEKENGDPLENIMVYLDGGMTMETPTKFTGRYAFGDLPTNHNYSVKPFHDLNPRKGVSTLDLVLISRHLLGLQPLTSPYQVIAADTDNSGDLNTFDIIEAQKVILYIQDKFSNNTSWRFVDAAYQFADPMNPFSSTFPEVCLINGLDNGVANVDFVGIKVGDVNGSASPGVLPEGNDREDELLEFMTINRDLNPGEEFLMEIKAKDFKEMLGFQFTFDFDPAQLQFMGIEKGAIARLAIGESHLREGLLTCNWYEREAQSFSPETVLFSLRFIATSSNKLSEAVTINSGLTRAEAYTSAYEIQRPSMAFREVMEEIIIPSNFELFPNRPNPFKDETIISFQLPKASKTILTITDVSGRVLKRVRQEYAAGYHEVPIAADELKDASGVLYYQLITSEEMATRKMVLVKR